MSIARIDHRLDEEVGNFVGKFGEQRRIGELDQISPFLADRVDIDGHVVDTGAFLLTNKAPAQDSSSVRLHPHAETSDTASIVEAHRTAERACDLEHGGRHAVPVVVDRRIDFIVAAFARLPEKDPDLVCAGGDRVVNVLADRRCRIVVADVCEAMRSSSARRRGERWPFLSRTGSGPPVHLLVHLGPDLRRRRQPRPRPRA